MNNYHIYEEIGRGKHSTVYKGRRKKTIEYVAVKSVDKSRRKKVLNEVRILHTLDHHQVLKFHNWYETRNHLWIIYEYCAGGDLLALMEQDKGLPEPSVRTFAQDLVAGMLYLHSQGVIFADLKPSNLLFDENGQIKYADFGLARRIIDITEAKDESKRGTPYYMAPELFQDDGVYSYYTDFWSLGCVLYEMATGQPPFVVPVFQDLVTQIVSAPTPNVPGFSDDFNSLIGDLLQKDPARRISWEELVVHPFFCGFFPALSNEVPVQPLYQKYLQERGVSQRSQYAPSAIGGLMASHVDVMRISQNVQRNLLRESFKEGYEQATPRGQQVVLQNRDQEIDIGNKGDEEDDAPSGGSDPEGLPEEEENTSRLEILEEDRRPAKFKPVAERTRPMLVSDEDGRPSSVNPRSSDNTQSTAQTPSSKASIKTIPVDQLLLHNSDTTVKPIIGNKEIEKVPPVTFNPQTLHTEAWDPQQVVAKIDSPELEAHLNQVYSILMSSVNAAERLNLLSYFELIISNSTVANRIVNSVFVELLLRILRSSKTTSLRARICSIIGQIVRHATVIETEVAQMGIGNLLADYVKDKNDKVRRRAMAALGEYLFYAATQTDDEHSDPVWEVSTSQVALLIRVMRQTDDEVLRFYAVKTIENITAQSQSAGVRFAISDTATQLIAVFNTSKLETLRVSAIVAVSHVTRLNPSLFAGVIERLTLRTIVSCLTEGSARVQQAILTMLILGLQSPPQRLSTTLLDDRGFFPALVGLFENNEVVIRGKSLLVFMFLVKLNTRWLSKACEGKFFPLIERMSRDNYKYVQCCLHHLVEALTEITHLILQNAAEEVSRAGRSSGNKAALTLMPLLEHVCASPLIRQRLNYDIILRSLSGVLTSGAADVVQVVLSILDGICSNQKTFAMQAEVVLNGLLPAMMAQINLDNADLRCQVLKATYDLLMPFLSDIAFYEPGNSSKLTTKLINELLIQQVLPLLPKLLRDQDPIPLYAQKLVSAVLDHCLAFVSILKRHGVLTLLLDDFEPTQTKLNAHIVSIVKRVVESKEVSLTDLASMHLVTRLNAVIQYLSEQDWCLELTLDILLELLFLTAEQLRATRVDSDAILVCTQPLIENLSFCVKLSQMPDLYEKASNCLTLIIQLYGRRCLRGPIANQILSLLRHSNVNVVKAAIKLVHWGVLQGEIRRETLERTVLELLEHSDSSVSSAAMDLYKAVC
mmetsp:Transcript_8196/g.16118  ORF Transcript_8196/g.16118 Transcript_8196/m.16118 type:complete len:1213 (+) Transcript_8196:4271-7909(+)